MRSEASKVIDKPVSEVFRFYADDHVTNHPRWDPDVTLELASDGPVGVGTVIKRHIERLGRVTDGHMTVTRFDRDASFRVDIEDGPMKMRGGADFEAVSPESTRLTVFAESEAFADAAMVEAINGLMQRSLENLAGLMDAEAAAPG